MTKQSLNDIRHSFLTISSDIRIRDSFELRMLEENKINGLLDLSVCDDDGILNLNFDITGKEPLSGLVTVHKLTASDIRHIILCLKHVLSGLEPYLLSGNGIVLSAESVYMDPVTFSPSFLYLPGRNEAFSAGLTSFLQSILSAVDHEDYNSVVLAYRLFKESENDVNAIDHLEQMLITPDIPDSSPAPEPAVPADKGMGMDIETNTVIVENIPEGKPAGLFGRLFHRNETEENPPQQGLQEELPAEERQWLKLMHS